MKRNILYTIFITWLLASCVAEQDNPLIVATCTDGIRNGNETDIDCGGHCQACEGKASATAPCASALVKNTITFNNTVTKFANGPYSCEEGDGYFEMRFLQGNLDMLVELNGKRPATNTIYKVDGELATYKNNQAVLLLSGNRNYVGTSGYLYVTVVNNQVVVEFCSIQLRDTYSGYADKIITGKVVCE